jgi:long-subunit fatty acid transport protein
LQFIAHTHMHRKLSKNTEGSLGFTYSDVWQGNLPVPELRPFQEFFLFTKINDKWRFSQRFRTEQRWFHNYSGESLTSGYNFKFRFRYMPRLEYRLTDKWILKSNAELMYHNDDFDQWRAYGGVEYKIKKDLSLEVGYLKLLQKRANNKGYFDRDNVRITIYKDFDLSKKEVK